MKRILLSAIGCLLLVGCTDPYNQKVPLFAGDTNNATTFKYTITVIDKCEYITFPSGDGYVQIAHKGNCTNCQAIFRAWYAENK